MGMATDGLEVACALFAFTSSHGRLRYCQQLLQTRVVLEASDTEWSRDRDKDTDCAMYVRESSPYLPFLASLTSPFPFLISSSAALIQVFYFNGFLCHAVCLDKKSRAIKITIFVQYFFVCLQIHVRIRTPISTIILA
jgi:hypothetical protein